MNFEDDISKDIAAAIEKVEAPKSPDPSPAGDVAPPSSKAEAQPVAADAVKPSEGERARDGHGRFKGSEAPKEPKPDEAATAQPAAAAPEPPKPLTPAPANWKGAGKVEWSRLPQVVQKEIADEFTRVSGIEGEHQKLKSAIGDRATVLAAQYGSTEAGLQNLFAISDFATQDAPGFIRWFMQQRGLDPTQIFGQAAQPGQQPADGANPFLQEIGQLKSQFTQLQQRNAQLEQMFQQAQTAPLQAEVQSFASDPKFPYFNDVRLQMKALIEGGVVQGSGRQLLENAYNEAIWSRPEIRSTLLADQEKKRAEENAAKVAEAKKAAGSLTGAPAGGKSLPASEPDEDLEATIRRNVSKHFGAAA